MTMRNPPKLLEVKVDLINAVAGTSNRWKVKLTVTNQFHSNTTTDDGVYTGIDIIVGDYITTTTDGRALRISSILNNPASPTNSIVYCNVDDVDEVNAKTDPEGNFDGSIVWGSNGILFEVVNNIPVLFPIPKALSTSFNQSFASQLLSRFLAAYGNTVPENVLTEDDIDTLIPGLISGKVPIGQLPVGTNPTSNVAPGGDYLLSISRGNSNGVAPLENGKIPPIYIPTIDDQFETYTAYSDLLAISNPSTSIYYIVTAENAVYKYTGTAFIRITGEATQTSYSYVSVSNSNTTYAARVKDVISVIADNVTILLPSVVINGDDIIILNNGSGTIIDPNGNTIRNNSSGLYYIQDITYSTYLVYVDGWQFSESNKLVNLYTQQPGADQFGPADYWPAGSYQKMEELTIYGKEAYLETWESTRSQIVTILSYQAPYGNNIIRGTTTTTDGWVAKDVDNFIDGDRITITGASGNGNNLNGTWEITAILSETQFEFVITNPITYTPILTSGIGNTIRIIKEKLAEQATIFEPDSDNFRSIWFPKSGFALERYVTFNSQLMPTVRYANNLVLTVCKILNLDWKSYERFNILVESDYNFKDIIERQPLLDIISSNSDFIQEFINSRSTLHYENPTMVTNNTPTNNLIGGSSKSGTSDFYKAFDASLDTAWESATGAVTNQYLTLTMPPTSVSLFPYSFTIYTKLLEYSPRNIKLEYKGVDGEWYVIGEYVLSNDSIEDTFFIFKAGIASNAWRFTFLDCYSTERMAINNIKIRGWNIYGL